jgi:prepilin-type N-terminal cleavage/methylation domain-containing protein
MRLLGVARRRGFTLVEILMATVLSLILLAAVVRVFGAVGQSINNSRAALESADRLRSAASILRMDLEGVTVKMYPPRRPEEAGGYFEYVEGTHPDQPIDSSSGNVPDTTVTQRDDRLLFTSRNATRPFVGRFGTGVIESDLAEVAWFVRGNTLHRRKLLIAPALVQPNSAPTAGFYANNDLSVYVDPNGKLFPNTLSTLTRRECRFAHPTDTFPFDLRRWGQMGLPTLRECSASGWMSGTWPAPPEAKWPVNPVDLWSKDATKLMAEDYCMQGGTRIADDVMLTNVIGFDVKAWDNQLQQYVDLGAQKAGTFGSDAKHVKCPLFGTYDTWSTHYENEGLFANDPQANVSTDGFADGTNATGVPDDVFEPIAPPPYGVPLRGIQIKIRVFEPDSRQIREVTVVQDFLPK